MENEKKTFIEFHLNVLRYELIYGLQKIAYEKAEEDWLKRYGQRRWKDAGSYRNAIWRMADHWKYFLVVVHKFSIGGVTLTHPVTMHIGTDEKEARRVYGVWMGNGAIKKLYQSHSGRLDGHEVLLK